MKSGGGAGKGLGKSRKLILNRIPALQFALRLREIGYFDKLQTLRDICEEFRHPLR